MNKNIAKKWVKALRSGKYKQGGGYLKTTNNEGDSFHCCLGVLCELYNEEQRRSKKKQMKTHEVEWDSLHDQSCPAQIELLRLTLLPKNVQDWAGMKTDAGEAESLPLATDLAELNDSGTDFDSIATIIENNVDML